MDRRHWLRQAALGAVAAATGGCRWVELVSPSKRGLKPGDVLTLPFGPFTGVFDASDPAAAPKNKASAAVNMVFPDVTNGAAALMRPGFAGMTTRFGADAYEGNGCYQHIRQDGTIDRLFFSGAKMFSWTGADVVPTDVTPVGVTIDGGATTRVYCASYAGKVIVNDEVNKPWVYDPVAGTGTLIQVDSTPSTWAAKGPPVIYGGKVFFLLKTKGGTAYGNAIVWCEELQPTVGYLQTGYNDYWQLLQTSDEALGGLAAEEAGLIYLRQHGIGSIVGTVDTNFKANATRDTISTTVGTNAPASIVQVNQDTWFVDLDGRVHRMRVGGGEPEPMWEPMRPTIETQLASSNCRANVAANAFGAYHESLKLVLFTIWDRHTAYVFDARTGAYCGIWNIADIAGVLIGSMCSMSDSANRPVFVFTGTRGNYEGAGQGTVLWRSKRTGDWSPWVDQPDIAVQTAAQQVDYAVRLPWMTGGARTRIRLTGAAVDMQADGTAHTVYLLYHVPTTGGTLAARNTTPALAIPSNQSPSASIPFYLPPAAQGEAIRLTFAATEAEGGSVTPPDVDYRWGIQSGVVTALVVASPTMRF